MLQEIVENQQDSKRRITFVTSIPIHPLGIEAGETITIDYTWNELHELFTDLHNEMFKVVVKDSNEEECIIVIDGIVLELEDIFRDEEEENTMKLRSEDWDQAIDFAAELNKLGVVQLHGMSVDPTHIVLRSYEGKVFSINANKKSIKDIIVEVKQILLTLPD